jgi:hypothetical protein
MTELTSREMIERAVQVLDRNARRFKRKLAEGNKRTRGRTATKARPRVKSKHARKR